MADKDLERPGRGPAATRRTLITGTAASVVAVGGVILADRGTPALAATGSGITDWVNVIKDYQADPHGGVDSTSAFQKAINSLPSGGGVVYVPTGTYAIHSGPLMPWSGMRLTGDGYLSTHVNGYQYHQRGRQHALGPATSSRPLPRAGAPPA